MDRPLNYEQINICILVKLFKTWLCLMEISSLPIQTEEICNPSPSAIQSMAAPPVY